ncbi:MAG TPA: hypothetical protein VGK90_08020 [Rhizomicrobium sp.]
MSNVAGIATLTPIFLMFPSIAQGSYATDININVIEVGQSTIRRTIPSLLLYRCILCCTWELRRFVLQPFLDKATDDLRSCDSAPMRQTINQPKHMFGKFHGHCGICNFPAGCLSRDHRSSFSLYFCFLTTHVVRLCRHPLPEPVFLDGNLADITAMNFIGSKAPSFFLAIAQPVPHIGTGAEYDSVMFTRHFVIPLLCGRAF